MVRHSKKDDKSINPELKQFAGSLVDGVIRTVSETKAEELCVQMSEMTAANDRISDEEQLEEEN